MPELFSPPLYPHYAGIMGAGLVVLLYRGVYDIVLCVATCMITTCVFSLSQVYQEKSKYISDQLSVLKTQMDDLKMEDRMTRNDLLHEESIRLGNNKRLALDKVCTSGCTGILYYDKFYIGFPHFSPLLRVKQVLRRLASHSMKSYDTPHVCYS